MVAESTTLEAMKIWIAAIHICFVETYLRQPFHTDLQCQIQINIERGSPRMFASLDCMHWTWRNCPMVWQGQFQDKYVNGSVILEAFAN